MPGRTTGAQVAGDVATTRAAAADVTQSVPGPEESPVPGEDTEVARDGAEPRRARPRPATAKPAPPADADAPAATAPSSGISGGGAGVRRRLARLGAPRGGGINPMLEPLI